MVLSSDRNCLPDTWTRVRAAAHMCLHVHHVIRSLSIMPAGMQQRSALDDIESLVRASQDQQGNHDLERLIPRSQATKFAAERAVVPQHASSASLLDVVEDSRPASGWSLTRTVTLQHS